MKKKVLITGISGFVGSHLAEYLNKNGEYDIVGTIHSDRSLINLENIKDTITLHTVDLTNFEQTYKVIAQEKPDLVFHLAALPDVGLSFEKPAETMNINIATLINVLQGMKKEQMNSRILLVSSADVYGKVSEKDIPIDEDTPFMPTNTYAVSKIAQDFLGLQYYISFGMPIIRVRPFNHMGPRQRTGFVVADFAKKIAEIEKNKIPPVLKVGNLESRRDFTDVRDMVRAYALLIEEGIPGEVYNIGSDSSHKIEEIVQKLISFSAVKIDIEVDSKILRPEDALERISDSRKFRSLTDWQPQIPLEQTLKDTLDYWRNIV